MRKREYGRSPRKGSKQRKMLLLMLRPQGATSKEVAEIGIAQNALGCNLECLINQKGWDIRTFPLPKINRVRYKVVGKFLKGRGYRSLISWTSEDQAAASPR